MPNRTFSFRNTAIGLTAGVAFAAAAAFPAAAGDVSAVKFNGSPACAHITDPTAGSKCEIEQSELRTKAANVRGAAAKAATSCMTDVEKDIAAAKAKGPLTPDTKAMFRSRIEKCDKIS
jgi:hypothetical protein